MNNHLSTTTNNKPVKLFINMNLPGFDMNFSDRLRIRMTECNLRAVDIAKRLDVSRGTVSQWVNGIAEPSGANVSQLAAILRCNVSWLMLGKGSPDKNPEPELSNGPEIKNAVPLISWIQAGSWLEMDSSALEATHYQHHTATVGPRAFALRVMGDSMTASSGRSIPDGSIVIVDPDIAAEHGRIVIARLDDNSCATIKQLVIDGSQKYLKPLNPAYPILPINGNCTIIGVVKQVIMDL